MDYSVFEKILIDTALSQSKPWLIGLASAVISLLIEMFYHRKTGDKERFVIWRFIGKEGEYYKDKLNHSQFIAAVIFAIVCVLIWLACLLTPIYKDIVNRQYVRIDTQYMNYASPTSLESEEVCIQVDGEDKLLELPAGWKEEQFPIGTFYGIVWYSEESEIILMFQQDTVRIEDDSTS